ncbi:MAG: acetyl-CoA carboxylase, carboxyltransferase subunit beta [Planctomycetota bacterium]
MDPPPPTPAASTGPANAQAPNDGRPAQPRSWADVMDGKRRNDVPAGLWWRCPNCGAMTYRKQIEQNLSVCPECGHHYRIDADERVRQLVDPKTFEELWSDLGPVDALKFVDRKPYADRLNQMQKATGRLDALVCGKAYIKGRPVVLAAMDSRFIMASMGSVVGEKIARCAEHAAESKTPLIIVCAAGGARMMESSLALMQMAKTSAAIGRLHDAGGLFIPILTDPTTGGVTASFAMLGDVILAEPGALIGFAGPRVIANTVRQELPEGFQRAEFVQEKGFVDRVVPRANLRSEIARIIDFAGM